MKPICQVCTLLEGATEYCPNCIKQARGSARVRTLVRVSLVVGVLAAGAGAVGWLVTRPRAPKPVPPHLVPPKYGGYTTAIERSQARLEKEPCDRKIVLELTRDLLKAEAPRDAITAVDAFTGRCPPHERLLWDKYSAHKRLSEPEQAAQTAGQLMELNPTDYDYPWWRGEMLEAAGKLEEAIVDYRLALSLLPRNNVTPFQLTDALIKAGRPCEAVTPLNTYLYFHPGKRDSARLNALLARLEEAKCEVTSADGSATFQTPPGGNSIPGKVKINGVATGQFVVDTGASLVVLSRSFAQKAGLSESGAKIRVRTAGGIREASLVTLATVDAQGARAKNVEAAIIDDFGHDGLLGLSFLSRFKMTFDGKTQKLKLLPPDRALLDTATK